MLTPKAIALLFLAASAAEAFHGACPSTSRGSASRRGATRVKHAVVSAPHFRNGQQETSLTAKNPTNNDANDSAEKPTMINTIKKSPGTLIAAPFVLLIGVDLVLNVAFLVKRTVEYFVFGKLPSTEVWFSDNLFL